MRPLTFKSNFNQVLLFRSVEVPQRRFIDPKEGRGGWNPEHLPMARLQAATMSTDAIVTDPQAVRKLCENHCFGTLDWEVTDEGELTIWGYDDFEVYEARENGLPDYDGGIVTHEFLRKLADHLEADEELDIQTAGFTKCRRPVLAKRYVVRDGKVLHADLSSPEPIDE